MTRCLRKAKMEKKAFIGIDLGGTNMRAALVDTAGSIVEQIKISTEISQGAEPAAENLLEMCRRLMDRARSGQLKVEAVGMGVAGKIDPQEGIVVFSPNLPAMDNFPLGVKMEQALGIPVIMENDANVFGLGENWVGSAQDLSHWVGLTLGTGVGGALILNNRLWQGDNLGFSAEVGHLVVDPKGPRCTCGSDGCLESHSSGRALMEGVEAAVNKGKLVNGKLFDLWQREKLTAQDIYLCGKEGDPASLELFQRMGWALGIAISNIFMLLGIRHAIIGGGVSASWDLFIDPLMQTLRTTNKFLNAEQMVVRKSVLGDDAALLGAARLAWDFHRE